MGPLSRSLGQKTSLSVGLLSCCCCVSCKIENCACSLQSLEAAASNSSCKERSIIPDSIWLLQTLRGSLYQETLLRVQAYPATFATVPDAKCFQYPVQQHHLETPGPCSGYLIPLFFSFYYTSSHLSLQVRCRCHLHHRPVSWPYASHIKSITAHSDVWFSLSYIVEQARPSLYENSNLTGFIISTFL